MFSNHELASFINSSFEPAWQSVRKVPIISIDLGNGKVMKRTLNGNIASYVCTADGQVLDVLPGLYEPESYKDRLLQLCMLNLVLNSKAPESRDKILAAYHKIQLDRLAKGQAPARFVQPKGKGIEAIFLSSDQRDPVSEWARPLDNSAYQIKPLPKDDLAQWQQLIDDVRLNETEMRKKIHARLLLKNSTSPVLTVSNLTRWMYRDVLHADLDDPYFGLGQVLNKTYPFQLAQESEAKR